MKNRSVPSTSWLWTAGTVSLMAASFYFAACGGGGGGGGSRATTFSGNVSETTALIRQGGKTHRIALSDLLGIGTAYAAGSGITVSIPSAGASTVTDDTGSFVLVANASGEVEIEFEGPGFNAKIRLTGVPAGGTVTLENISCDNSQGDCQANVDMKEEDDDDSPSPSDSPSDSPSASNSPSDDNDDQGEDEGDSPSNSDDDSSDDDSESGGGGNSGPG